MITYHLYIDLLSLFIPCHITVKTKKLCNTSFFFSFRANKPIDFSLLRCFWVYARGIESIDRVKKIFKWFFKY